MNQILSQFMLSIQKTPKNPDLTLHHMEPLLFRKNKTTTNTQLTQCRTLEAGFQQFLPVGVYPFQGLFSSLLLPRVTFFCE